MRTLQQIMDSLEQAIYLRAREKESDRIRDEYIQSQDNPRRVVLTTAFSEFERIDELYSKGNRAPH